MSESEDFVINNFKPVSLNEIGEFNFLNRFDTKYIFHRSKLVDILNDLSDGYRILQIENDRVSPYLSTYYDTDKFELYLKHHNQHLNRYKLRWRKYLNTGLCFFEVKFKNNKNKTIKYRIKQKQIESGIPEKVKNSLVLPHPVNFESLNRKINITFTRITFVCNNWSERFTIDYDLKFADHERELGMSELVIAEIKQAKVNRMTLVGRIMRKHRIRSIGFSKYCLAITQLFPKIKKNNFNKKLRLLQKLINDGLTPGVVK
jgi:hypothetical protein